MASALDVGMAASREFGLSLLDLNAMNMEYAPISDVSESLIRKHRALPLFKRGKRLYVATSDPTNLQGLDEIKFNTGLATEPVLVEDDKLGNFIDSALSAIEAASLDVGDEDLDGAHENDVEGSALVALREDRRLLATPLVRHDAAELEVLRRRQPLEESDVCGRRVHLDGAGGPEVVR